MTIGDKIKKFRKYRNMTQKQLGVLCGFSKNTADVRIRQYESNSKIPRESILRKISQALNIHEYVLINYFDSPIQSMYALFEFEEMYGFDITENKLKNENPELNKLIDLWTKKKQELNNGKIEENEYIEWKLNFKNA